MALETCTRWVVPALVMAALSTATAAHAAAPTTLRCGVLIDGRAAVPRRDVVITVADGRIVAVAPAAAGDAAQIDRSADTCLPGLIDAHAHILIETDDYQVDHLRALVGVQGAARARRRAGHAAIRVDDDSHRSATRTCTTPTSTCDGDPGRPVRRARASRAPATTCRSRAAAATSTSSAPEHARRRRRSGRRRRGRTAQRGARGDASHGSDWIKVLASGAMMSAGNDPNKCALQPRGIARDRRGGHATRRARGGARAFGGRASRGGPRGRAHDRARHVRRRRGHAADGREGRLPRADALRRRLLPRTSNRDSEAQAKMNELTRRYRTQHIAAVGKALRAGVQVGVGTDYVGFPVKQGVRELKLLVEAGMTPMQAIQAATRVNAELLGWQDRVGTVEPGKLADIIAVPGDPLQDLAVLERVEFVMLGGEVVCPGTGCPAKETSPVAVTRWPRAACAGSRARPLPSRNRLREVVIRAAPRPVGPRGATRRLPSFRRPAAVLSCPFPSCPGSEGTDVPARRNLTRAA